MAEKDQTTLHQHELMRVHILVQKQGIPVEVQQLRCAECDEVLDERTVGRAHA